MPRPRPRPVDRRPRNHRAIKRLTAEILSFERKGNRAGAEAKVEVGRRLHRVHAQLEHGEWLPWLEEEVPYGVRTAQRAIALYEWADANPRLFKRLAHLGTSKLYLLSTVKPKQLRRLADAKRIVVPGSGAQVPLDRLSYDQLFRAVKHPSKPLVEELERRKRIKRITRGIRRITETTAELAAADVSEETAAEWHAGLLRAAAAVASRFGLG